MKTMIFCFFYLISISACGQNNIVDKDSLSRSSKTINLHEGSWYSNFKNEVFIRCLKRLYPQSFSLFIDSTDASSSANMDWLSYNTELLKIVDSLSSQFMKRKSTSWSIENKKVTLNVCMDYRNSAELDSLAVFYYRKFQSKK
jgi:hypothetical protein